MSVDEMRLFYSVTEGLIEYLGSRYRTYISPAIDFVKFISVLPLITKGRYGTTECTGTVRVPYPYQITVPAGVKKIRNQRFL